MGMVMGGGYIWGPMCGCITGCNGGGCNGNGAWDVLVDALHDMVDALHDMGDVLVDALHDMGERPVDALGGS